MKPSLRTPLAVLLATAVLAACGTEPLEPEAPAVPTGLSEQQQGVLTGPYSYWAYPVIVRSAVRDASESGTSCTGNINGFMYLDVGTTKGGNLPYTLGGESYNTCVYASNFQGPVNIGLCSEACPSSKRYQYEWSIDWGRFQCSGTCNGLSGCTECGNLSCPFKDAAERLGDGYVYQVSTAKYPLRWGKQGVNTPSEFTAAFFGVKESDPTIFAADDHVGGFYVDRLRCKTDVFDKGLTAGWTAVYRVAGSAYNSHQDIGYVDVKHWCYRCDGTTDCKYQVGAELGCPTCGDGVCNGAESCSTCASDCGYCPPPPSPTGSCQGLCGTSSSDCWCDSACVNTGDCCSDYNLFCGGSSGGTCIVSPCPL